MKPVEVQAGRGKIVSRFKHSGRRGPQLSNPSRRTLIAVPSDRESEVAVLPTKSAAANAVSTYQAFHSDNLCIFHLSKMICFIKNWSTAAIGQKKPLSRKWEAMRYLNFYYLFFASLRR